MSDPDAELDAVELEILRTQLESVAEEMGQVLIRGAYSPNITERRDCSTALFDVAEHTAARRVERVGDGGADARMIAQAEHIPVHLGAMPAAVAAVHERDPDPGDVFALNDPFTGGTHLPDVTLVSPLAPEGEVLGYAVSRAHHADVGGTAPGSMPAGAREIHQEGLRIPPVRLVADGEIVEDVESLLLANVRNPEERRADLRAQVAANERAERRIGDLLEAHGDRLYDAFEAVIDYSRERIEAELRDLPDGEYRARDVMEGDGAIDPGTRGATASEASHDRDIPIEATVTIDGETLAVDFSGTADQVPGNVNAPLAVARSAVYYVVRCVTDPDIPPNHGCYEPVSVEAPEGSLLNPRPPAAVVGGNVETSQRVTDVVFAALAEAAPDRVPAGGQGTMNNLVVGNPEFQYYETIGGGAGARPDGDGLSGVQVGMTNTLNTPVEALEAEYPLRVAEYALRAGSGGAGRHRGGDGLIRAVRLLSDATVSLLTERRRHAPRGLAGGEDGEPGRNLIGGEEVPAKTTREVAAGATVRIETPGGGGHGSPDAGSAADSASDASDERDGADGR